MINYNLFLFNLLSHLFQCIITSLCTLPSTQCTTTVQASLYCWLCGVFSSILCVCIFFFSISWLAHILANIFRKEKSCLHAKKRTIAKKLQNSLKFVKYHYKIINFEKRKRIFLYFIDFFSANFNNEHIFAESV